MAIEKLLDQVLLGDEQAYRQFAIQRLKETKPWQFQTTLEYILKKLSTNPTCNPLDTCYMDALLELANWISDLPAILSSLSGECFINLLKNSAKKPQNYHTKLALLGLHSSSKVKVILLENELSELQSSCEQALKSDISNRTITLDILEGFLCLGHKTGKLKFRNKIMSPDEAKSRSIQCFASANHKGSLYAAQLLATMIQDGNTATNIRDTCSLLGKAFDKGNVFAGISLADCLLDETLLWPTPQNARYSEAYSLYAAAGKMGIPEALVGMSNMVANGKADFALSIADSSQEALNDARQMKNITLLTTAADLGFGPAKLTLGLLYLKHFPTKLLTKEEALKKAFVLLSEATRLGERDAPKFLADMHLNEQTCNTFNKPADPFIIAFELYAKAQQLTSAPKVQSEINEKMKQALGEIQKTNPEWVADKLMKIDTATFSVAGKIKNFEKALKRYMQAKNLTSENSIIQRLDKKISEVNAQLIQLKTSNQQLPSIATLIDPTIQVSDLFATLPTNNNQVLPSIAALINLPLTQGNNRSPQNTSGSQKNRDNLNDSSKRQKI